MLSNSRAFGKIGKLRMFPHAHKRYSRMAKPLLIWGAATLLSYSPVAAEEPDMLLTNHPLANSLWHVATNERMTNEHDLAKALIGADYVLLGEKHDNPLHHKDRLG